MIEKIDLGNVRGKTGQKGKDGLGITDISRTGRDGLTDTYTITYSDGHTTEFTVTSIDSAEMVDGIIENDNSIDDKVPSVKAVRTALLQKVGSDYTYSKTASDNRYVKITDIGETVSSTSHTHSKLQADGKIDTSNNSNMNVVTDEDGYISLEAKPTIDTEMDASSPRAVENRAIKSYVDAQVFQAQTNNQITIDTTLTSSSTNPVQANAIYSALEDGLSTHTHTKSQITDISFGSESGTFCEGNDSRLTDARNMKTTLVSASSSNNTNIDNFTTTGLFHFFNNSTIQYVQGHLPSNLSNKSFYLFVQARNNNEVKQVLTRFDNSQTWIRVRNSGTWGDWREVSNVGHTHTKANITDFSHSHNQITNDGKIGTVKDLPLITTDGGVITVGSFGTDTSTDDNKFVSCADARLSDSRTPTSHSSPNDTFGLGTSNEYGHCKIINNLTTSSVEESIGCSLSAFQGYLLNAKVNQKAPINHSSESQTYGISTNGKYGHSKASNTLPLMDGSAFRGNETSSFARGDHIHPTDTSRQSVSGLEWKQVPYSSFGIYNELTCYYNDFEVMIDFNFSQSAGVSSAFQTMKNIWNLDTEPVLPSDYRPKHSVLATIYACQIYTDQNGVIKARSLSDDSRNVFFKGYVIFPLKAKIPNPTN